MLAHYFSGAWDDALLTAEQGLLEADIHRRPDVVPLMHLAATCVAAGRGAVEEAERHAHLAGQAAEIPDLRPVRLYSAMARALLCQAAGDYQGIALALRDWWKDQTLDGLSRMYTVLWRPLLIEGLIGSGQHEQATGMLSELKAGASSASYLQPALFWLLGWLTEERGRVQRRHARSTSAAKTRPERTARRTGPGCCWPTVVCSGGWATVERP